MRLKRIRKLVQFFSPPKNWRAPVIVLLGVATGLGAYIFKISNAPSYLSDDPDACINCHVMFPEYTSWERSSHGRAATCNDCHVPQNNIINTYWFKANDGMRHSYMFTFRLEPQVIRIKQAGKDAVQRNCIRCHENLLRPVSLRAISAKGIYEETEVYCWDCHRYTPHGKVRGLSSAPNALAPKLPHSAPEWMIKLVKRETK